MIRLNKRTVQLNSFEIRVSEAFQEALSEGLGIADATVKVINDLSVREKTFDLTPAFVAYLSDNTVRWYPQTREVRVLS